LQKSAPSPHLLLTGQTGTFSALRIEPNVPGTLLKKEWPDRLPEHSKRNHMSADNRLSKPVEVGRYSLPNRLVMAPMTHSRADDAGMPSELAPV
jgi:hypothetical protein